MLTDFEYLHHMIPHHVVAIDMSELLMTKSKNPYMLNICRNIIRKQKYEIWEMEIIKKSLLTTNQHYPLFSSIKGRIEQLAPGPSDGMLCGFIFVFKLKVEINLV
jgi:hypothetical protein